MGFTVGVIFSPMLAFFVTIGFWSLSELSRALENPFSDGPNQLPVIDMHEVFVELIRSIYDMRRPRRMPVPENCEHQLLPEEEPESLSPDKAQESSTRRVVGL